MTTLCEGEIAIFQNDRERAGKHLERAAQQFAALNMRWHLARARDLLRRASREDLKHELTRPTG